MKICCFPQGPLDSNCYAVLSGDTSLIFDPSVKPEKVLAGLAPEAKISGILITHGHNDHLRYIREWITRFPEAGVYMSKEDDYLLKDPVYNCSYMLGEDIIYDFPYEDASGVISLGAFSIKVIPTPGHTKGSVCYLVTDPGESALFSGDTLFAGSMGRCDMEGGNFRDMMTSLGKLSGFDSSLPVFPGHGPDTTIGNEIRINPYMNS